MPNGEYEIIWPEPEDPENQTEEERAGQERLEATTQSTDSTPLDEYRRAEAERYRRYVSGDELPDHWE